MMAEQDEQAAPSPAPEPDASAGTEKAEKSDKPKENYVPQSRLNEMAAKRREAESKVADLEAKLADLSKTKGNDDDDDVELPGEPGSMEQVKHLIQKYAGPVADRRAVKVIEEHLGMSLKDAKAKLADAERSTRESQWVKLCAKSGADPYDKKFQGVVHGLATLGDLSFDDAMEEAVKIYGVKKSRAKAETGGATGDLQTISDWLPKDDKDAIDGAAKGRRAKQLSSEEIIEQRLAKGK